MAASTTASGSTSIAVSVVLPTRGQPHLLDRCLDALMRQTLPAARFEVIIVDDAPNQHTLRLVARWRARTLRRGPRLVYVFNGGPHGPAAARNRGWRIALAPLIAFTGDDAVPAPGWLAAGLAACNAGADAACGRIIMPPAVAPIDCVPNAAPPDAPDFAGANCFCRKQVLERLDGFDERFTAPWREDSDLYFRLLGIGAAIVHAPQAVVARPAPPVPWGASLLDVKKLAFDALLYKKHPRLYRERIPATLRLHDYGAVAALLLAGAAAAAGQAPPALLACLAWLALTLRLCARRLAGSASTVPHVAEIVLASALPPPLAVFWRLAGAIRFRVRFA